MNYFQASVVKRPSTASTAASDATTRKAALRERLRVRLRTCRGNLQLLTLRVHSTGIATCRLVDWPAGLALPCATSKWNAGSSIAQKSKAKGRKCMAMSVWRATPAGVMAMAAVSAVNGQYSDPDLKRRAGIQASPVSDGVTFPRHCCPVARKQRTFLSAVAQRIGPRPKWA